MLKSDITPSEKVHVRKSIEQHRKGVNKRKLQQVRVVGATCAACPFKCLADFKFQVVILDECSQITEPASMLPIARCVSRVQFVLLTKFISRHYFWRHTYMNVLHVYLTRMNFEVRHVLWGDIFLIAGLVVKSWCWWEIPSSWIRRFSAVVTSRTAVVWSRRCLTGWCGWVWRLSCCARSTAATRASAPSPASSFTTVVCWMASLLMTGRR